MDLEAELDRLHDLSQSSEAAGRRESESDESLREMKKTIHDLEGEVDKLVRSEQILRVRNKQLEDEIRNLKTLQEVTTRNAQPLGFPLVNGVPGTVTPWPFHLVSIVCAFTCVGDNQDYTMETTENKLITQSHCKAVLVIIDAKGSFIMGFWCRRKER